MFVTILEILISLIGIIRFQLCSYSEMHYDFARNIVVPKKEMHATINKNSQYIIELGKPLH